MDFFDILIALLFVSVTNAGKLIDKKLKKSADSTKKIDTEEWKEILDETINEMREGPETTAPNIRTAPAVKPAAMPVEARGADEPCKTDKNRIDPKKLIIYSEIMTPKFRD